MAVLGRTHGTKVPPRYSRLRNGRTSMVIEAQGTYPAMGALNKPGTRKSHISSLRSRKGARQKIAPQRFGGRITESCVRR